jgi:hypothetical protein
MSYSKNEWKKINMDQEKKTTTHANDLSKRISTKEK